MKQLYRGDIYYIEAYQTVGSEQRAGRPAIVVSNDMNNNYSSTVEIVYLTTQPKNDLPTHVTIRSISRESIALCEQITSIAKERFGDYIDAVTEDELQRVDAALLISLGLDFKPSELIDTTDEPLAVSMNPADDTRLVAERDIYKDLYENLLSRVLKG